MNASSVELSAFSGSAGPAGGARHQSRTLALTIGAIGVVFGDIGTSPLYAFREALNQMGASAVLEDDILGILSLMLWALILVVSIKYVLFLMRADNHGEGGVLSLMALAQKNARSNGGTARLIVLLGAAGAALFYGDAIITPSLSVLSAVEGLNTVPIIGGMLRPNTILLTTAGILVLLFGIQGHGTAHVAKLFGPVCVIWFLAIGALGIWHVVDAPRILLAFDPSRAIGFLLRHSLLGLFVLGAVFLTVTGAEALTADMGHFGRLPIRIGWFSLVFPALSLNYLGQGAMALKSLAIAERTGGAFANADWFFLMAPDAMRGPLVILATMATIIASQAVITGAYSLTQQAIALGLFPRMMIRQTSEHLAGQIYIPVINWTLLAGVIYLVFQFRSSSAMAAAYGIAVTGTMVITTILAMIVVRRRWGWPLWKTLACVTPFLLLDLFFFGANSLRISEGGWVPLLVAGMIGIVIVTWLKGRRLLARQLRKDTVKMSDLAQALAVRPPRRVAGTAVFLTGDPEIAPAALLHNLKHNRVLHERNTLLNVQIAAVPHVDAARRIETRQLDENFVLATLHYGYMESPDVPAGLALASSGGYPRHDTSYFISRNSVGAGKAQKGGLPFWQDVIFIFLQKNATDPTAFFHIPPNRVVELGSRIEV